MKSNFSTLANKRILVKTEAGVIERIVLGASKNNLYVKLGLVGMGVTGQEPWIESEKLELIEVLN